MTNEELSSTAFKDLPPVTYFHHLPKQCCQLGTTCLIHELWGTLQMGTVTEDNQRILHII